MKVPLKLDLVTAGAALGGLLLAGHTTACGARAAQNAGAMQPDKPAQQIFTIDLDTSGGFSGRGRGGVTIKSDGTVRAARFGTNREAAACQATLTAADLDLIQKNVQKAVSQQEGKSWPATVDPAGDRGCCDRFQYTLRLGLQARAGEKPTRTFETTWHDSSEKFLPPELAAITEVALRALTTALQNCK